MIRRPILATLAALGALLAGACGGGDDAGRERDPAPGPDGSEPQEAAVEQGERVPADVVVLTEGDDAHPGGAGPGLVVDGVDVRAFAGRFLPEGSEALDVLDDLAEDVEDGAGDRVYVGGVVSSACTGPADVEVRREGGDVRLVPVGLEEGPDEVCDRAVTTVALAALDRDDLPGGLTIDGEPPWAPVGPGDVVVVAPVHGRPREAAEELRTAGDTEDFLDDAGAIGVSGAGPVGADVRRFGFVISGCRADGAELVVGGGEITAVARQEGHEDGREVDCERDERYVVVADVPVSASGGLEPEV